MKTNDQIKQIAITTLQIEADAIKALIPLVNDDFVNTVNLIFKSSGRVVITGIGKSAIIAQKITATLNSTGTPAIFMHAADAIHGDLGIIQKDDTVIIISKSGNTPEIKVLIPWLKMAKNKLIAIVGNTKSYLAKEADLVIDSTVVKEACPNNLAPTSSTLAQMAIGDALAVCLLSCKDFTSTDFAKYHPGGTLGKKLYLKAGDIANANAKPMVSSNDKVKKAIVEISYSRLGAVAVVDNNLLVGIVTDGDIRRMMEKYEDIKDITVADIMGKNPKAIETDELAVTALQMMQENNVSQLVVVNQKLFDGFIHLHDLIKEGII